PADMSWRFRLLLLPLVALACEREFGRPEWHAGGAAGSGGSSVEAGAAGEDSGAAGVKAAAAGTGGRAAPGSGGASSKGGAGGAGNDAAGSDPGSGGYAGEPNRAPIAVFDSYRFRRGADGVANQAGAGGTPGAGDEQAGGAGATAIPETTFTYPASKSLLENDSEGDGGALRVKAGTLGTARGGSVTVESDGRFSYTPPSDRFWGNDSFRYTASDGEASSSADVRVTLAVDKIRLDDLDGDDGNGWTLLGSPSREYLGAPAGCAGDVNGDGLDDLIVAAQTPYSEDDPTAPDVAYVVFGRKDSTAFSLDESKQPDGGNGGFLITDFRLTYTEGQSINGAGDLNGDGLDDLVLTSLRAATDASPSVYVLFGRTETTPIALSEVNTEDSPLGLRIDPRSDTERFGLSVAGAGDVNGDGYDDLVIGAPGAALDSTPEVGLAYVVFGRDAFGDEPVNLRDVVEGTGGKPGFLVRGSRADSRTGFSVAGAGDVNGDGLDDLVIGASEQPYDITIGGSHGAAYVVFGAKKPATVDLSWLEREEGDERGVVVWGNYTATLGYAVSGAGYFDGDGLEDVVFGMPFYQHIENLLTGGAYVAFGRTEPRSETLDHTTGPVGYLVRGFDGARVLGKSVASGDFDGDGRSDASLAGNFQAAEAYLLFGGGASGIHNISLAGVCTGGGEPPGAAFCIDHSEFEMRAPTAAGDFNGDGFDDVYLGSPNSRDAHGAAYVVFGWDIRDRVGGLHLTFSGGAGDDTIDFSGGDILRFAGGHGLDTIALTGAGLTWDLRAVEPTRLDSIERIDLTAPGKQILILDDDHVRWLPSSRRGRPLAKTLTVLGGAGDTLRFPQDAFEELPAFEERRVFQRVGGYYGLEVDAAVTIVDLEAQH
ncbi:MAG TPA: Ig-like domain-containing protein, partial [Polyangiaceae bacterium]